MKSVPRRPLILFTVVLAVSVAGLWSAWHLRQQQARAAQAIAGVAALPDLRRWPAELKQRIQAESSAVRAVRAPLEALGRLATLYCANGYPAEAERALAALRQLDPKNARWPCLLADLRWRAGDGAGAEAAWQVTVERDATYAPAWLRLGELLTKRGANDRARECFIRAFAAAPDSVRAAYHLIQFEVMQGGGGESTLRRLRDLARGHPGIKDVHELLAGLLDAAHDPVGATQERRRAVESELVISTEDPWVDDLTQLCFDSNRLMLRAVTMRREGRFGEAETLLKKAIGLAAHEAANPLGWELLSDLYVKLERPAEARALLEQAVAQFPAEPQMRLLLARLLCTTQQPEAAIAIMQQAVGRWPERGDLHAALGLARHDAGQHAAAVSALGEALRLDPTLTEAQYQLGLSLIELGRPGEAKTAISRALAMRPDYPEALFALAALELDAGDFVAAEPSVFKVYALDPEEPNAQRLVASWHLLKGRAAGQTGDVTAADRQFRAGLAVAPDFALLLRETGRLAERRTRWTEAAEAFEHYVRVQPADPSGYLEYGLVLQKIGRPADAEAVLQRGLNAAQQAGDQARLDEFKRLLAH